MPLSAVYLDGNKEQNLSRHSLYVFVREKAEKESFGKKYLNLSMISLCRRWIERRRVVRLLLSDDVHKVLVRYTIFDHDCVCVYCLYEVYSYSGPVRQVT